MRSIRLFALILTLMVCTGIGFKIIDLSAENQRRKRDYAEINNIKYGLFSINQWKKQLSDIINIELSEFDPKENKEALKPLIEQQLTKLIESVDQRMREKNKKTFKGRVKQSFINMFVDMKDIKAGVPKYADEIFKIMQKPRTKRSLKALVAEKVQTYFQETFEEQDMSKIQNILLRLDVSDVQVAKDKLDLLIAQNKDRIVTLTWSLLGISATLFLIAGFIWVGLTSVQFITLLLVLFILLVCGVTTPMIDLEAKISEMSFMLMDHPVKFLNQILYFQTKSVLDVFWLMVTNPEVQMKVVGVLMAMFSIVFPVSKLIACALYYYNHWGAQRNKLVNFFVLKSGKWSMADVMIIAIFMAYIGFNGVISSQFGKLHSGPDELVLLTTNGTSLQPGFYLFLSYAILALFLSEFLTRKIKHEGAAQT